MFFIVIIICLVILLFVKKGDAGTTVLRKIALGVLCAIVVLYAILIGANFF